MKNIVKYFKKTCRKIRETRHKIRVAYRKIRKTCRKIWETRHKIREAYCEWSKGDRIKLRQIVFFFLLVFLEISFIAVIWFCFEEPFVKENAALNALTDEKCLWKDVRFWQLFFSILVSCLFIVLMIITRRNKLQCPELKKDIFEYFSHRSYISRHKLKIRDKKHFALWRNHYPYIKYNDFTEFKQSQKALQNKEYEDELKNKLQKKILSGSKWFIGICIVLSIVYAVSCIYELYSLINASNKNDISMKTSDTAQVFIFNYRSPLLDESQKMEIKIPATMLRYNYKGKHYQASNLVPVDTCIESYTSFKINDLQFHIDADSLRIYNKNNEYPELYDLSKELKRGTVNIRIEAKNTMGFYQEGQSFTNLKEKYYSDDAKSQNIVRIIFDMITTLLLLWAFTLLSYTTTQEHNLRRIWSMVVLISLGAILCFLDIYVAKMLVENQYIFAHWLIQSLVSLFAAMTIASFASRMYPQQYQEKYLTGCKVLDIVGFFIIYVWACANILTPFIAREIINISPYSYTILNIARTIILLLGITSLYFVMYRFTDKKNLYVFFIHEINNLRTMEKENIGIKELHLLMQNKDREEDLLNKDNADDQEIQNLRELKKREKILSEIKKS